MKEHPIIFSGEMVMAILAGKKTQTRRVVKFPGNNIFKGLTGQLQQHHEFKTVYPMPKGGFVFWDSGASDDLHKFSDNVYAESGDGILCPYGKIGDRLWLRETWAKTPNENRVIYRADYPVYSPTAEVIDIPTGRIIPLLWKPSIHLPMKFSRITLEMTGVRVERVQEISANDALAEGVQCTSSWAPENLSTKFVDKWWDDFHFWTNYPQMAYQKLWDSINAKHGYSWENNPWVWVIEFRKVEK